MCLNIVYRGNEKKEALAKLPESGYYWKVVKTKVYDLGKWVNDGRYHPSIYNDKSLNAGWNRTTAKYANVGYKVAFHLYRNKKDALTWTCLNEKTIRCRANKKDIVNIGKQQGHCRDISIVTKRFWMPRPR